MASPLKTTTVSKLMVLLDTNVLIDYLEGKPELAKLFSPEAEANVQYAINPVVLQELLLIGPPALEGVDIDNFFKNFVMLPLDATISKEALAKLKAFRDKRVHANDLLILGSAVNCDYMLSSDVKLKNLGAEAGVKVIDPGEFLSLVGRDW